MLDLLSKIFGPHRAVSIFVFMQNRGAALLAGLAFVIGITALLMLNAPREHEHVAFVTLPILTTNIPGNQIKNGLIASVRLADGTTVSISTSDVSVAKSVTDTACVEQRQFTGTAQFRYRLKLRQYCQ